MKKNIYILDDDQLFSKSLSHYLSNNGHENVSVFENSESLFKEKNESPEIIILDHFLTNEIGLKVLENIKEIWPETRVIYLSGQEKVSVAIESIRVGAYAYVEKKDNVYPKIKELIEAKNTEGSYLL